MKKEVAQYLDHYFITCNWEYISFHNKFKIGVKCCYLFGGVQCEKKRL